MSSMNQCFLDGKAAESGQGFYPKFTRSEIRRSETLINCLRTTPEEELDFDALNVFFRMGSFVGTDTPFLYVKADPPDYEWIASTPAITGSREQIIDAYINLFRQAVGRCDSRGQTVSLGLSGGRDSRHILFELCRCNRPPARCWTVDLPAKPLELAVAKQICQRLKLSHSTFRLSGRFAEIEAVKNRVTSFSSLQHAWLTEAVLKGMAETPVLFDGIGGDVLSAGTFLTEERVKLLAENRIDELVEHLVLKNLPAIRDLSLFPRQRALEKVSEELRKHLKAPDPISSFYFWNRTRRDIGSSAFALLRQRGQTVYAPFLDPDLSRFLAGLRPSITVDHRLHTDVIARAYPEHADIPYADVKGPVRRANRHYRKVAADTLRYLVANNSPMIQRKKVCVQLVRAATFSSHSSDVLWLGPSTVYLTELWKKSRLSEAA